MIRIEYLPDVYIDTVFARIVGRLPDGTFYPSQGLLLPYTLMPTNFRLTTQYPGQRHVIKSTTVPVLEQPLIPQESSSIIKVPLQAGDQTLTIEAYDANNHVVDSYNLPLNVFNFGTLAYAGAQTIVKEWVEAIDLYSQVISGYQLLVFETSLPNSIRDLLPKDYNTKLLALKNLMRVSLLGSSSEGINSFISAVCQMNPPKITRFFNAETLSDTRAEDSTFETMTSDIKLWFGSFAMARRAVLHRLANNFPERYKQLVTGNSMMFLERTEYANDEQAYMPTQKGEYILLDEDDDAQLTQALAIVGGDVLEVSSESETEFFIPNYHWTDYHDFHGVHDSYVPANVALYGDQRWFSDPLGNLDRIAEVYVIPDLPESRLDPYGFEDEKNRITFHASNSQFLSNYGLEDIPATDRDMYEAIDEAHVGFRNDASDQVKLDLNDGRSQPWITSDWDYDILNGEQDIDYHQGWKCSVLSWAEVEITIPAPPPPYVMEEEYSSIMILQGYSRPTEPGARESLDLMYHYSEDESLDSALLGYDMHNSAELWSLIQRRTKPLPDEFYQGVDADVPPHQRLLTLTTGMSEAEFNPFQVWDEDSTEVLGDTGFWSTNSPIQDFILNNLLDHAYGHKKLLLAMHRNNLTGEHSLIIYANRNGRGSNQFSSELNITLRGIPIGVDLLLGQGADVRMYSDRFEISLAWYGNTDSYCVIRGFQGFDSITESKFVHLDIQDLGVVGNATLDNIMIVGPNRTVERPMYKQGSQPGAHLALELLY